MQEHPPHTRAWPCARAGPGLRHTGLWCSIKPGMEAFSWNLFLGPSCLWLCVTCHGYCLGARNSAVPRQWDLSGCRQRTVLWGAVLTREAGQGCCWPKTKSLSSLTLGSKEGWRSHIGVSLTDEDERTWPEALTSPWATGRGLWTPLSNGLFGVWFWNQVLCPDQSLLGTPRPLPRTFPQDAAPPTPTEGGCLVAFTLFHTYQLEFS